MKANEFDVEFTVGGIEFNVLGTLDDGVRDSITKVQVWDGDMYVSVPFDPDEFADQFGDVVDEAIEKDKEAEKDRHGDDVFDRKRDDGLYK